MANAHIAFYRFVGLEAEWAPAVLRERIRGLARESGLLGTVILAPEGINGFLAGREGGVQRFWSELTSWAPFEGLSYRLTAAEQVPFKKLKIKLKAEIIPMRRPEVRPALSTGDRIPPGVLRQWLDEGRPLRLIDTRNDYEVAVGTFRGAEILGIKTFQEFSGAWAARPSVPSVPIVMFCTGGIRCEKATAVARTSGGEPVYQLEGGILGYFETCGRAHFEGECFVFDERGGL